MRNVHALLPPANALPVRRLHMNIEKYLPYMLVGTIAVSILAVFMVNR
jgi:hypothetical protein